MRVLLALDGSAAADAAREAVNSIAWPEGSVIHVLGVLHPEPAIRSGIGILNPNVAVVDDTDQTEMNRVVRTAAASLRRPTRFVDAVVAVGRPASLIVETAASVRAELIVVGSRGRGPLRSMVLGSVSAEVVSDAACAVLVVRETLEGPLLMATDGSTSAEGAISYLIGHRFFIDRQVNVLAVAHRPVLGAPDEIIGLARGASTQTVDPGVGRDWVLAEEIAARATARFSDAGYLARMTLAVGDPAHRIIEAAEDFDAGVIVTGSRGLTGLRRLLLGSVARNVLLHSSASVLVVHEPLRETSPEHLAAMRERAASVPVPA